MATQYNRMSIAEKQAHTRGVAREQAVTCPACETHVLATELLDHVAKRCQGPREPHPAAMWIRWGDACRLGVPNETLRRWIDAGKVRHRGEPPDRQYLLRDLAMLMAARRTRQRRDSRNRE